MRVPHVDHHRGPDLAGELELAPERLLLDGAVGSLPVVVKPDLTDGDNALVDELAQRIERLAGRSLMRMDAERDVDVVLGLCELARHARRVEARADGDHPRHSGGTRPDERGGSVIERIQVRVRVDHNGSSFLKSGAGSRSF